MEDLFVQLNGYLQMESELPFEEFSNYYLELIARLNAGFDEMSQEACLKARYICSIVQVNADTRAKQNKAKAKAFKKMSAKCSFWTNAINYRLLKDGMSQVEIDQATEKINENI
ncbi:MAG: hypothetical protein ACYCVD_07225 [Desulfitobacteriaceae bacterium]